MLPRTLPTPLRVKMRAVRPEDEPTLTQLWVDDEVRRYLGGAVSSEEAKRRFARYVNAPGAFAVFAPDEPRPVGIVMLTPHVTGDYEVSYMLRAEAWGKGYALDAMQAVFRWALGEASLPRVIAVTQTANTRSTGLLRRLGMVVEAHVIEHGAPQMIFATPLDPLP